MHQRLILTGLALGAACAAPCAGQDALGSGTALDAALNWQSDSVNRTSLNRGFRDRNLVVTGNVAAGRGFRGTVGYTAESDFRVEATGYDTDELGSDDLYRFRAGSAMSSPNFIAAGLTMNRLRFGEWMATMEIPRAGRAFSGGDLGRQRSLRTDPFDNQLKMDSLALTSQSRDVYEASADGEIVGVVQGEDGQQLMATASSVLGIQQMPSRQQVQAIGLTSYDVARTLEDINQKRVITPIGSTFKGRFTQLMDTGRIETPEPSIGPLVMESPEAMVHPFLEDQYRSILEGVAEKAAEETQVDLGADSTVFESLDAQLARLRQQLSQFMPEESGETPGETSGEDAGPTAGEPAIPLDTLLDSLQHRKYLERLSQGDGRRFDELMSSAEEALRDGEYFWAERRFVRALRYTPGHPLAQAGMGHAQLGAGLHISAALTLRRLMRRHPEMIDVRYDASLLPAPPRLNAAVRRIRELIAESPRDRDLRGFMLAYIGHQIEDPELIAEGLGVMRESSPDDPLLEVLEHVWD